MKTARIALLSIFAAVCSFAQTAQTTVADTVKLAINGQNAIGSMSIAWPSFTLQDGTPIAASSQTVRINLGAFSVQLYPTVGATPTGGGSATVYYTVTYSLTTGSSLQEQWSVPASAGALKIANVLVPVPPELTTPSGASLPSHCKVGDLFYLTSGSAGENICVSANTWTQLETGAQSAGLFVAQPTGTGIPYVNGQTTRLATGNDVTTLLGFTPTNPSNNLNEYVNSAAAARQNLGVRDAATHPASDFVSINQLGAVNGAAILDANGKVLNTELPALGNLLGQLALSQLAISGTPGPNTFLNGQNGWMAVDWSQITNKPTVPTDNAQLANGAGYEKHSALSAVAESGRYADLLGSPAYGNIVTHDAADFLAANLLGQANGVAGLGAGGLLPLNEIPAIPNTQVTGLGTASTHPAADFLLASALNAHNGVAPLDANGLLPAANLPAINYSIIAGTPTIPTKLSQLANDTNFLTLAGVAPVAISGAYADLTGKPSLAFDPAGTAATLVQGLMRASNNLSDLTDINAAKLHLNLAGVASTGVYGDLSGLPTISVVGHTGLYADLLGLPTIPAAYVLPAATPTTLGGVRCGVNLTCQSDGTISAAAGYVLPPATASVLGGVIVGNNLQIDGTTHVLSVTAGSFDSAGAAAAAVTGLLRASNNLSDVASVATAKTNLGLSVVASTGSYNDLTNKPVIPPAYTLPAATPTTLGGVICGANLACATDGTISAAAGYVLPQATNSVLGGVKVGADLLINATTGVLSVDASQFDAAGTATAANALALQKANNLSDLPSPALAKTNLGLSALATSGAWVDIVNKPAFGDIVTHNTADFQLATLLGAANGDAKLDGNSKLLASELPPIPVTALTGAGDIVTHNANEFVLVTAEGAHNGVATLDANGLLTGAQLPPISYTTLTNLPTFATVATTGAYADLTGKPAGLPPIGAATGDLGGNYPAPTVKAINGQNMAALGAGILAQNASGIPAIATTQQVQAAIGFTPLNAANNLSDVQSAPTSRTNLGLGTAATHASTDFLPNAGAAGFVYEAADATTRPATTGDLTALLGFTPLNSTLLGAHNGIATLDANGLLTAAQIPQVPYADITGVPSFLLSSAVGTTVAPLVNGLVPAGMIPAPPLATTATAGTVIVGADLKIQAGVLSVDATQFDAAGTAAGLVAGSLKIANNLSDLQNAGAARANLGLSTLAATGAWADIVNKPSFSTVATTGSYADLSNKPVIPTDDAQLTNTAGYLTAATLPLATASTVGTVKIGSYLTVDNTGLLYVNVGTGPNSVAAGNDPRIASALSTTLLNQPNGVPQLDASGKLQVAEFPTNIPAGDITGLGTSAFKDIGFFVQTTQLGAALGAAQLDLNGKVQLNEIPNNIPYSDITGGPTQYVLPTATGSALGGVMVGTGLGITGQGLLSVQFGTGPGQVLSGALLGVANGVAALDGGAHIPVGEIPTGGPGGIAILDGSSHIPTTELPVNIPNGVSLLDSFGHVLQSELNVGVAGGIAALDQNGLLQLAELPIGIPATDIGTGSVTNTAFGYISGLTSDAQSQLVSLRTQISQLSTSLGASSDPTLANLNTDLASGATDIIVIGDSISINGGSMTQSGATNYSNLWVNIVKSYYQGIYGSHGTGLIPIGGFVGGSVNTNYWFTGGSVGWSDPNLVHIGPYQSTATSGNPTGGMLLKMQDSSTAGMNGMTGDHLRIYCAEGPDTGSGLSVNIDGAGVGTACGGSTGGYTAQVFTFAVASGSHNFTVTSHGINYLYGAQWVNGSSGVSVTNISIGSASSNTFGSDVANQLAFLNLMKQQGGSTIGLLITALGTNDPGYGYSTSTYGANLTNIINYVKGLSSSESVLVMSEPPSCWGCDASGNGGTDAQFAAYWPTAKSIAGTTYAYVAIADTWGDFAAAKAQNFWYTGDWIHPNDTGDSSMGQIVINRLTKVVGNNSSGGNNGGSFTGTISGKPATMSIVDTNTATTVSVGSGSTAGVSFQTNVGTWFLAALDGGNGGIFPGDFYLSQGATNVAVFDKTGNIWFGGAIQADGTGGEMQIKTSNSLNGVGGVVVGNTIDAEAAPGNWATLSANVNDAGVANDNKSAMLQLISSLGTWQIQNMAAGNGANFPGELIINEGANNRMEFDGSGNVCFGGTITNGQCGGAVVTVFGTGSLQLTNQSNPATPVWATMVVGGANPTNGSACGGGTQNGSLYLSGDASGGGLFVCVGGNWHQVTTQ